MSTESHPFSWTSQPPSADDTLIEDEPSRHVDYLSHDWKEEDIWSSWRYVTSRRNDYSNGVRLENASWRTWAKAKHNLKTISPESLNWYVFDLLNLSSFVYPANLVLGSRTAMSPGSTGH